MEKRSLHLCVTFLEQIAKQTSSVVLEICAEQCTLNDQVKSISSSTKINNYLDKIAKLPQRINAVLFLESL